MTQAHTPGPWYITPDGDITAACIHNSIIVHGSAINAYDVQNPAFSSTRQLLAKDDGGAANAHLIAAAPELLEALRAFSAAYCPPDGSPLQWEECNEAYQAALAAISKAEGK